MRTNDPVLVIGAGLGGLTAAIALARAGLSVEVHEAASELRETGAGLTLGRGAQHVFRDLGIQREVAAIACPAGALPFLHYQNARLLMGAPDRGDGRADDGVSDIVRHCYRADLQTVLIAAAERLGVAIQTGRRLIGLEQNAGKVIARFADGSSASGSVLVGADGVRSAVRALLFPGDEPRYTNHLAYRFLVPADQAEPFMALGRSAIFIGPKRTFNRYTMAGGKVVNCAGLVETDEVVGEGWSISASRDEVARAFAGWHPDVLGLIEQAGPIIKWGLYDRTPLPRWSVGRVTLLGDAAHAMLPFLGAGAAMAIEDGWALARALQLEPEVETALARYEAARRPRTELLHAMSKRQGEVTQAINPDTFVPSTAPLSNEAVMGFNPVEAGV
ncbi:FAD-dependent monooxygenase [Novosphingobium ginsenosidimutans]|uniref:FAD-binding protein n=1 Tax=Novosphingobium ginsenosidimutans TaxID=1176536 RepID=A0A5B8S804_9SPHN|nr:FAD-dependent monooxygenase [Novosphingobium ginsenosidimutans]QEA16585.1 FAD-binding protein [Novosphingobium ginsenosidimutans]